MASSKPLRCLIAFALLPSLLAQAGSGPAASAKPATPACRAERLQWGVNVHQPIDQWPKVQEVIAPRGLTRVRLDMWAKDSKRNMQMRAFATKLRSQGIEVSAVLFDSYANGYPAAQNCDVDLAVVEQSAYKEISQYIAQVDDVIHDFELLNEIPLYPNIKTMLSKGHDAADFDTPCGRLQAANLRGMSRAIVDERKRTGLPLRIILGTVARSFGFYKFMQSQGVSFDVVGYHIYPIDKNKSLDQDPWFGDGGALGQLARFNKPIHINEFHCGEIYKPTFENKADQPETETCLRSVARHLKDIANFKGGRIESVYMYELTDEPRKHAPENRFGLMYDLDTPKVGLFLLTAFAGGKLSEPEQRELTRRQLLTPAQIAAWSGCGARP
ncbi:MAG TPA: hypothetical protein VFW93_02485 [Aquabacterium sp.]|uniref:hypothetical protein n=1 Tax=Aquabacterium sp. TaxID=1872578 RepID=UPI002E35F9DE|nr:hypothetical protein [Aquabacterium sp.]HEX5355058.1 hypothetical protein [Aquabacterium sp.]